MTQVLGNPDSRSASSPWAISGDGRRQVGRDRATGWSEGPDAGSWHHDAPDTDTYMNGAAESISASARPHRAAARFLEIFTKVADRPHGPQ